MQINWLNNPPKAGKSSAASCRRHVAIASLGASLLLVSCTSGTGNVPEPPVLGPTPGGGPTASPSQPLPPETQGPVNGIAWADGQPVRAQVLKADDAEKLTVSKDIRKMADTASVVPKNDSFFPSVYDSTGLIGSLSPANNYNKATGGLLEQAKLVRVKDGRTTEVADTSGILASDGPRQLEGLDATSTHIVWAETASTSLFENNWRLFGLGTDGGKPKLLDRAENHGGTAKHPLPYISGLVSPVISGNHVYWNSTEITTSSTTVAPPSVLLRTPLAGGPVERVGTNLGRPFKLKDGFLATSMQEWKDPESGEQSIRTNAVVRVSGSGKQQKLFDLDPEVRVRLAAANGNTAVFAIDNQVLIIDLATKQAWTVAGPAESSVGEKPDVCADYVTWSYTSDGSTRQPQYFLNLDGPRLSTLSLGKEQTAYGLAYCGAKGQVALMSISDSDPSAMSHTVTYSLRP